MRLEEVQPFLASGCARLSIMPGSTMKGTVYGSGRILDVPMCRQDLIAKKSGI